MSTLAELVLIAVGSAIVNNVVFVRSLVYPRKQRQLLVWEAP